MVLWLPGGGWEDETALHPQEIHWISVLGGSHSVFIPDLHNPFGHVILLIPLIESFFFFFFLRYVRICLYCSLLYGYICIWESLFYVYRLCLWIVKTIIWLSGYILFISLFSGHLKILCQCHIMLYLCNILLLFYNAYHDAKH